jgi:hypothetical protein
VLCLFAPEGLGAIVEPEGIAGGWWKFSVDGGRACLLLLVRIGVMKPVAAASRLGLP